LLCFIAFGLRSSVAKKQKQDEAAFGLLALLDFGDKSKAGSNSAIKSKKKQAVRYIPENKTSARRKLKPTYYIDFLTNSV
jgi:hypothetical protein